MFFWLTLGWLFCTLVLTSIVYMYRRSPDTSWEWGSGWLLFGWLGFVVLMIITFLGGLVAAGFDADEIKTVSLAEYELVPLDSSANPQYLTLIVGDDDACETSSCDVEFAGTYLDEDGEKQNLRTGVWAADIDDSWDTGSPYIIIEQRTSTLPWFMPWTFEISPYITAHIPPGSIDFVLVPSNK